jgi:hypothetical protein
MSWCLNLQSWLEVKRGESLSKRSSEPQLPPSPSLPTPPTYLPCAREEWARRGEMAISNEVVRGGGRNGGAVSAGGDEILPPHFSPARGSSRHLHGRSRSCGGWPLLAHGSQRRGWLRGNTRFGGIPRACVEGALTCVRATFWMQHRNPINGLLAPPGLGWTACRLPNAPLYVSLCVPARKPIYEVLLAVLWSFEGRTHAWVMSGSVKTRRHYGSWSRGRRLHSVPTVICWGCRHNSSFCHGIKEATGTGKPLA